MSSNNDNGLWYWPDGLYMLIPVLLTWALWFIVFLEHALNLASVHEVAIRFQALFARIVLMFPLVSTVAFVSAALPPIAEWMWFLLSLIEVYCVIAFYAMLIGLGFIFFPGDRFKKAMVESFWTKRPLLRCGPEFPSKESAFTFFTACVVQTALVKPVCSLVLASYTAATGDRSFFALQASMRALSAISLIVSIASILRVYKFLSEAPGTPLHGHSVLLKFTVIKLLFTFVIINALFLDPMIEAGVIPIDQWICSQEALSQDHGKDFCQIRLTSVILVCEVVCVVIPACFSYRHHGLPRRESLPKGQNLSMFFYHTFVTVLDLTSFIFGEVLDSAIDIKLHGSLEERESFLAETVMETEE